MVFSGILLQENTFIYNLKREMFNKTLGKKRVQIPGHFIASFCSLVIIRILHIDRTSKEFEGNDWLEPSAFEASSEEQLSLCDMKRRKLII